MKDYFNLFARVPEADAKVSEDLYYSDYVHEKANTDLMQRFPGSYGLPLVGRTFELVRDLRGLALDHYTRYGPVSRIQLGLRKGLLVLGPDISQRLFLDAQREFSTRMGYQDSLGNFFPGGLLIKDYDDHRFQRRILQSSFKSHALRGYVDTLNEMFARDLGQWQFDQNFRFFTHIKKLLLTSALKTFFGVDESNAPVDRLYKSFLDAVGGQMAIVPLNIPGLLFHRGIIGRDFLRSYVRGLIPERRRDPGLSMLGYMCQETHEDGSPFSDEEVVGHVNFILFAAHDTTTSTLTHMMYYLARHQDWQDRLREEAQASGSEQLDADGAANAQQLDWAFQEALRLHPSVPMLARRTLKQCELAGQEIPADVQLFHVPGFNHLMSEYWSNPYNFDPERFSPDRAEQKSHSFAYIPFGGGAHKCIGMHYANLQAKLFLHQFLLRYRFRLPDGYQESFSVVPLPKLKDDLPLIVESLKA